MLSRFEHPAILPAFPRRILATSLSQKQLHNHRSTQHTGVPSYTKLKYKLSLSSQKDHKLSLSKILFPYKGPQRIMSRNEALVCKVKRKIKSESITKTLQQLRKNFSTKTKKQSSFEFLKLLNFSLENCCYESLPKHPYLQERARLRDKNKLKAN